MSQLVSAIQSEKLVRINIVKYIDAFHAANILHLDKNVVQEDTT